MICTVDPCGTIFSWERHCFSQNRRFVPGGLAVDGYWYFADPAAITYPHAHVFWPLAGYRQEDNDIDDDSNIGELSPSGERGPGWNSKLRNADQPRITLRKARGDYLDGDRPAGTEWHGTEAAYLAQREAVGGYSVEIYDPATIDPELWASLPLCLRKPMEIPEACIVGDEVIEDDTVGTTDDSVCVVSDWLDELDEDCTGTCWCSDAIIEEPPTEPMECLPLLATPDLPILATAESPMLADCLCLPLLATADAPILATPDAPLLAACMDGITPILATADAPILATPTSPMLASEE